MRATSHTLRNNSSLAPHQQQGWPHIDDARILTVQIDPFATQPGTFFGQCGSLKGSLHQSVPHAGPSYAHIAHEKGESQFPLHTLWDVKSHALSRAEFLKNGPETGPVRPQDVISHEKDCHSFYCSIKHDRRSTRCWRRRRTPPLAHGASPSNCQASSPDTPQ